MDCDGRYGGRWGNSPQRGQRQPAPPSIRPLGITLEIPVCSWAPAFQTETRSPTCSCSWLFLPDAPANTGCAQCPSPLPSCLCNVSPLGPGGQEQCPKVTDSKRKKDVRTQPVQLPSQLWADRTEAATRQGNQLLSHLSRRYFGVSATASDLVHH